MTVVMQSLVKRKGSITPVMLHFSYSSLFKGLLSFFLISSPVYFQMLIYAGIVYGKDDLLNQ